MFWRAIVIIKGNAPDGSITDVERLEVVSPVLIRESTLPAGSRETDRGQASHHKPLKIFHFHACCLELNAAKPTTWRPASKREAQPRLVPARCHAKLRQLSWLRNSNLTGATDSPSFLHLDGTPCRGSIPSHQTAVLARTHGGAKLVRPRISTSWPFHQTALCGAC
jgi:hypothetical protein